MPMPMPMFRQALVIVPWFGIAIVLSLQGGHVASSFSLSPVSPQLSSHVSAYDHRYDSSVTVKYNGKSIVTALLNHPSSTASEGETNSGVTDVNDVNDVNDANGVNGGIGEERSTSSNSSSGDGVLQRVTLRRYLNGLTKKESKLRDMESLSVSIQMACKTISNLVNRNSINQLPTMSTSTSTSMSTNVPHEEGERDPGQVQYDMRMNSMKRLDQVSTNVLRNALRFTGKLQTIKHAKDVDDDDGAGIDDGPNEHQPGVLIASTLDSKYVA